MHGDSLLTVAAVFLCVVALVYQLQPLKRTKIWNLTLQQILLLIVIPGLIFPLIFSYLQMMLDLPKQEAILLSDGWIVNLTLMALLFAYGGIAIHAVTKVLSEHLGGETHEAARINRFFHMTFSHNLAFAGIALASLGLALLELNHLPLESSQGTFWGVVRGLMLGGSFALAAYNYTRYTGGDLGRWNDLKLSFMVIWIAFGVLLYGVGRLEPRISEYQLLLPLLLSFSLMVALSLLLVVRRLKRGGWRVFIRWKRIFWWR